MNIQAGLFLKSTPALHNTLFENVTIFITDCNQEGAIGFVINQPYGRFLHELKEFKHSRPFPLYDGGPVDKEHLFFLHRRPGIIEEGTAIGNGIYSGGNFSQAVRGINNKSLSANDIKIFVGYCGWDAGELEAEIKEGSWIATDGLEESIFG